MLPDSTAIRGSHNNPAKFADTGIEELIREMEMMGARRSRLTAKLAGGATMFAVATRSSDVGMIGDRNVKACKTILERMKIPILAENTGANYGRTVIFYPDSGDYHIRAVGKDVIII